MNQTHTDYKYVCRATKQELKQPKTTLEEGHAQNPPTSTLAYRTAADSSSSMSSLVAGKRSLRVGKFLMSIVFAKKHTNS